MQKLFRIIPLLFLLLCAEAHGEPIKLKKGDIVPINPQYVDYYIKKGFPPNVAKGFAEVISEEGASIKAPRKNDKYGRVGFSVTNRSHLYPELGLDKRDFAKSPVTDNEALDWVPQQFKGWDLQKAGNIDENLLNPVLHLGYMSSPDKAKDKFDALLAGKPMPFPTAIPDPEGGGTRWNSKAFQYNKAAGFNTDGTPDGSTSSGRSAEIRYKGPMKMPERGNIDLSKALLNHLGEAVNAPQGTSSEWFDVPYEQPKPRPKSQYRLMLEQLARGESIDTVAPDVLLKKSRDDAKRLYPR